MEVLLYFVLIVLPACNAGILISQREVEHLGINSNIEGAKKRSADSGKAITGILESISVCDKPLLDKIHKRVEEYLKNLERKAWKERSKRSVRPRTWKTVAAIKEKIEDVEEAILEVIMDKYDIVKEHAQNIIHKISETVWSFLE